MINTEHAGSVWGVLVEPLCAATEKLFEPLNLTPWDRLEIGLDEAGEVFLIQAYSMRRQKKADLPNRQGVWLEAEAQRGPASHDASLTWLKRVPERRESGYGRWSLKATDFTAIIIAQLWPRDRIDFLEGAQTVFDFLILRFHQQTVRSEQKARFKLEGKVPPAPPDFIDHPDHPLAPYQQCMHHTCIDMEGAAFFSEMGTGKTPPAIRRFMMEAHRVYSKDGRMYRCIVVCPKNVRTNWSNEIERFATIPGKVVVLRGGQLNRVKQLVDVMTRDEDSEFAVVICSYQTVSGSSWEALSLVEWDLAIADESHSMKSPRTLCAKAMFMLRDRSKQRMCLTGTVMANQVADYYTQLEFLGEGLSGFSSWVNFREYYQRYVKVNGSRHGQHRQLIGYKNLPLLQERLARLAFMITKKEALPNLPDKSHDVLEAEMGVKQREYYVKLQSQLAVEIEEALQRAEQKGQNPIMTATHILTRLLRLSQITAGFAVSDKEHDPETGLELNIDRVHWFPMNPKILQVIAEVKAADLRSKFIVWSCWVPVIEKLKQELEAEAIKCVVFYGKTKDDERERVMKEFNEHPGKIVFIGNPAAGGMGVNLPGYVPDDIGTPRDHGFNADRVIFYACDWSMIKRTQAEGRNHGKDRNRVPVRVTDLVVPGTIDEEIRRRVIGKQVDALQVQDVREIMNRLCKIQLQTGD